MTELKTLKDCNLIYGAYQQGNRMLNMIDYDEVKEEAIKWIKEMNKHCCINMFKLFFDLTEEDLK